MVWCGVAWLLVCASYSTGASRRVRGEGKREASKGWQETEGEEREEEEEVEVAAKREEQAEAAVCASVHTCKFRGWNARRWWDGDTSVCISAAELHHGWKVEGRERGRRGKKGGEASAREKVGREGEHAEEEEEEARREGREREWSGLVNDAGDSSSKC